MERNPSESRNEPEARDSEDERLDEGDDPVACLLLEPPFDDEAAAAGWICEHLAGEYRFESLEWRNWYLVSDRSSGHVFYIKPEASACPVWEAPLTILRAEVVQRFFLAIRRDLTNCFERMFEG